MRIGMMADVYKGRISGVTILLNKKFLEACGHEVFVFTFGDESQPADDPHVIYSPGFPVFAPGVYLSVRYSNKARKLLQTMDVVHVHHPFISGSLALLYCRSRRIPLIFTSHTRYDLYTQTYLSGMVEVIGETALQAYLPSFCRYCELIIAPSPGMEQVLQRFGVDAPIDVVPNGVDLAPFRNPVQPFNRSEWGIKPDDVVLVYAGRLGPEKNLSFLLRSFAGAALAYDHLHLMLVGDGPERDNLEDQAFHSGVGPRVHFTGWAPYCDMPRYLALGDAFVTASVTEVHPLSVIEAMAASLPVLGIQSPGVGDTIIDGETGYIVPSEDLAAYTAKMLRLAIEQAERRAMGQRAHQAAETYNIERTTQMMLERYQRVIDQAARRKQGVWSRFSRFLGGQDK